jgi:hypothetical protein
MVLLKRKIRGGGKEVHVVFNTCPEASRTQGLGAGGVTPSPLTTYLPVDPIFYLRRRNRSSPSQCILQGGIYCNSRNRYEMVKAC